MKLPSPPPPMRVAGVRLPGVAVHAGRQREQRVVAAVGERQVRDRFGRDRERPLAAGRLHQRRFARDRDDFARAADLDGQRAERDARAGVDLDLVALQRPERRHLDLHRVGVGREVGKDEVAGGIGRRPASMMVAARFADQRDDRARNHAALRVLDGAGDGAGDALGKREVRGAEQDQTNHERMCEPLSLSQNKHRYLRPESVEGCRRVAGFTVAPGGREHPTM